MPIELFECCQTRCCCTISQQWRTSFFKSLTDRLDRWKTRPNLRPILRHAFQHVFHSTPIEPNLDPTLYQLFNDQSTIGWHGLLYGFFNSSWSQLQDDFLRFNHDRTNTCNGTLWNVHLIEFIMLELHNLWQLHNDSVHGSNATEVETKTKQSLARKIRFLHTQKHLCLSDDDHLFLGSELEPYIKRSNSQHLKNWLHLYQAPIQESMRTKRARSVQNTKLLTEHFPSTSSKPVKKPKSRFNPRLHRSPTRRKRKTLPIAANPRARITNYFNHEPPTTSTPALDVPIRPPPWPDPASRT